MIGDGIEPIAAGRWLLGAAAVMLVLLTPPAYFIRNQIYKSHWQGNVITPAGYRRGNIIFFAMIDVIMFVAILGTLLSGLLVGLLAAAGAGVVQVINYPSGGPMRPTPPRFGGES